MSEVVKVPFTVWYKIHSQKACFPGFFSVFKILSLPSTNSVIIALRDFFSFYQRAKADLDRYKKIEASKAWDFRAI